ncbi:transcriptional regulator, LysR family [Acetobacteraceae bacterium AT-5844]|nr:transcriptional regulator, LysR family [Acetobacteraceae bacterium AT-5844]
MADVKTLDLSLLRALDALLETRSVTRAAHQLGLTQPAVSGMLPRLREAFQDPLFVRTQRGILPTPRAEAMAQPFKAALREIGGLLQPEAFDPAKADLTVSIAVTDYAQRVVILPFLTRLRRQAPAVRVSVQPVDMALITPEMAPDTLRARKLFDERYVCDESRSPRRAFAGPRHLPSTGSRDHVA